MIIALNPSEILTPSVDETPKNQRLARYAESVWRQIIAEVEALPQGTDLGAGRNDALFRAAVRLANFIPPPWEAWTPLRVTAALAPLCAQRRIPSWEATLESAINKGMVDPAPVPNDLQSALAIGDGVLRNFLFETVDDRPRRTRRPIAEIRQQILEACEGWPKQLNGKLFVEQAGKIRWLDDATALATWLDEQFSVEFASASGVKLATMSEVQASLTAHCEPYETIEATPHEPPIKGAFYTGSVNRQPTGAALSEFCGLFNPASALDALLLQAALVTPCWGGPPGERPAFIITSQHGRGSGKTATAQAICSVYGGSIDLAPRGMDWSKTLERLLSPQAAETRCVLIDNIKGRLDSAEVEAAITSPVLSGRALYVGEARRPNYMTWLLTANTPSLSSDLAARAIVIRLGKPNHSVPFKRLVRRFLATQREQLLADIIGFLRGPSFDYWKADRFFEWQSGVLSKFKQCGLLCDLIADRRTQTDDESAEVAEVARLLTGYVENSNGMGKGWQGMLTGNQVLVALNKVWPDISTTRALWARLEPLLGNGGLSKCERIKGGRKATQWGGSGLLWL